LDVDEIRGDIAAASLSSMFSRSSRVSHPCSRACRRYSDTVFLDTPCKAAPLRWLRAP